MDPAPLAFFSAFRTELADSVEYSFGSQSQAYGTMVAGKSGFFETVKRFTESLPYAAQWSWAVDHFVKALNPDTFLFKVDWQLSTPSSITLYARFPEEIPTEDLVSLLNACRPLAWHGCSPGEVASLLDLPGPRGIGLRVGSSSQCSAAFYYRPAMSFRTFCSHKLASLLELCGLTSDHRRCVEDQVGPLCGGVEMGVLGIDTATASGPNPLKFDPPNVPLSALFDRLHQRDEGRSWLLALLPVIYHLRATHASYVGLKYSEKGLAGAKLYLAVKPGAYAVPAAPRIILPMFFHPSMRLPHY
jgi:hypothetical protein